MFFPRRLLGALEEQVDRREVVVVSGMRRVGKTTLLRMVFESIPSENKVFLDLENPINQKVFEETNFDNVWGNLKPFGVEAGKKAYLFLDEIQAAPNIIKAVKYLYDHYDVKFFLTGSSSFYLKNLFPESLSGRKVVFELHPLDFQEFLEFRNLKKEFHEEFKEKDSRKNEVECEKLKQYYEEYLQYGGFPQVVLEESVERKKEALNDIFKSYFEKEVQVLADYRNLGAFRDLLLLLMSRVGSKVEVSKLSSEVGVSRETVYSYIYFLENTYFISLVSPFTRNADREVSGAKKVYACDNGIASLSGKTAEGSLLENAAYQNLRKHGQVYYYQKRSGAEIDFLLPDKKIALEVKTRASQADYRKLAGTAASVGMNEYYIITKAFQRDKNFIPAIEL